MGESNGNLPLRNCPECSVPEPYRSPDWALVLPKPAFGLNTNDDDVRPINNESFSCPSLSLNDSSTRESSVKACRSAMPVGGTDFFSSAKHSDWRGAQLSLTLSGTVHMTFITHPRHVPIIRICTATALPSPPPIRHHVVDRDNLPFSLNF